MQNMKLGCVQLLVENQHHERENWTTENDVEARQSRRQ